MNSEEILQNVLFYDDLGNEKIEEMGGKDSNQFELMCDLYAEYLEKTWKSKVEWRIYENY